MNEQELDELRAQLAAARAQIEELQQANDEMRDRIRSQSEIINRAKDITPFSRPSFSRVKALARAAFLDLSKAPGGGWLLSMGSRVREFKTLVQIWDILCLEDWNLEDLLGDYLVSKYPLKKIVPVLTKFWNGFRICVYGNLVADVYGDLVSDDILSQAQNSFETWNHCLSG